MCYEFTENDMGESGWLDCLVIIYNILQDISKEQTYYGITYMYYPHIKISSAYMSEQGEEIIVL